MSRAVAKVLDGEALALLGRLDNVQPYALHLPMVPAARVDPRVQVAVEVFVDTHRRAFRERIHAYRRWLRGPGRHAGPQRQQARFAGLKVGFNLVLNHFDLFSDVLTQRSEHDHGTWLAGLDVAAADALSLPEYFLAPPVVCYLDRGMGAAIRRARTRLPGGDRNPVAIVRVPRERLVGSSIASSLFHEVGHQAMTKLDLVRTVGEAVRGRAMKLSGLRRQAWQLYARWTSEILADVWGISRLGVGATRGLVGVLSMPGAFVTRVRDNAPHPAPWVRVVIGTSIGNALYPDRRWREVRELWLQMYPIARARPSDRRIIEALVRELPAFTRLVMSHRSPSLKGRTIRQVLHIPQRRPERLAADFRRWRTDEQSMTEASPSHVLAVISQAQSDGRITPKAEAETLSRMLTYWALCRSISASAAAAHLETEGGLLAR